MEKITAVSKVSVTELNPRNYRKWITEIKGYATDAKVWRYIDPDMNAPISETPRYPEVGDFTVTLPPVDANSLPTQAAATRFDQLTENQRQSCKFELESYKHGERQAIKIKNEVRRMRAVILESARIHIPDSKFSASGYLGVSEIGAFVSGSMYLQTFASVAYPLISVIHFL